ncbi:MAG TPA: DegT/DnrJ/EryC1/StrS family aminotransferase [Nanoarchaeota archaeon]|nr:MAG: aminotransferase [archaeon GW2011_AR6]HIH34034.1 DegT/DnrJ/EryC1/StrS family aminotransferase [Nanoarchaeota archaeon]HIH51648.1 DegT/DnrJ/EryC1/StrS family aminotransferase [Nanoarchaeota archaeon]HIH66183.1 DegT/DnrJ/EryC1/StrS family aminotransferase [Nanoarchaeota archaeon]
MSTQKIPLADLRAQHESIKGELADAMQRVMESGRFIGGEEVSSFEQEFASYCGKKHAVAVSSGTSALHLALLASMSNGKLKRGDEIVTVPNTFTATAEAIHLCDNKIKFADVDDYYLMSTENLRESISPDTKAIIPVDLYGQAADMHRIMEIAAERNLLVIEDAAQVAGAEYKGWKTPVADIGCFSFFPAKVLGTIGDGGAIVTDDEALARKARQLRDHGRSDRIGGKYEHSLIGLNYRLDAMKAAVLRVKLRHLDDWIMQRRRNAALYNELLSEIPGVQVPKEREGNKHIYYVYTIRAQDRDALATFLDNAGIATQIYYPIPLHLQEAYQFLGHKKGDFPVAERHAEQILSLPIYPEISGEQIEYVCDKIKEFYAR